MMHNARTRGATAPFPQHLADQDIASEYVYVHFLTNTADITSNYERCASGCNFNIMRT